MNPYYDQDGITIYHGDCREILPALEPKSVDLVLTDPPYAIPTVVAQTRMVTRNVGDLTIVEAGLKVHFDLIVKHMRKSGRLMVFCDQTSYPVLFRVFYGSPMALLVWNKLRIGMGREFRKTFELILHVWSTTTPVFSDGRGRPDVLVAQPVGSDRQHPAQKPVGLLRQLLEVASGTILDPFMGSGTTLVAAKLDGRRAIGIEIEERYCEIAARRLAQQVFEWPETPSKPAGGSVARPSP